MTLERIAGLCFCIVITSAIATGQTKSQPIGQGRQWPGRGAIDPTYEAGDVMPLRRVETRSTSGGREVVVETVETLDIDGRVAPFEEIVTETTRTGRNTAQTRRDLFGFTFDNSHRRLAETTESRQDGQPDGATSAVYNTWAPDLDGHLRLTSRRIEETRLAASDLRQTDTTLLLPDLNNALQETERAEYSERRINPAVVRLDSTHLARDINGRWRPIEIRRGEVRETGPAERTEEETIQRPDLNGKLAVTETNVIRRSRANEQEHEVIETYAPYIDGLPRADGRPPLSQRVHRTTTATADGGRYTVEEVEARSLVSASEPLRVIRRIVTTVRPTGTDQWETERQVFEPDLNGRMRLIRNE